MNLDDPYPCPFIHDAFDAAFNDAESDSESGDDATPSTAVSTVSSASKITPIMREKLVRSHYKLLFNGDGNAGKTCFLIRATTGEYPQDYIPSVFENYAANIRCNKYDVTLNIGLWDTHGRGPEYSRIRPLAYANTDLMVLCFDVTSRVQFDHCFDKYLPEVLRKVRKTKFVLLGLKSDLRTNEEVAQKLAKHNMTMVSREEAEEAAAKFKMPYFEVSALEDAAGVSATFQSFASLLVERRCPAVTRTDDDEKSGGLFGFVKRLFSGASEKPEQQQQQQVEQEQVSEETETAATATSGEGQKTRQRVSPLVSTNV